MASPATILKTIKKKKLGARDVPTTDAANKIAVITKDFLRPNLSLSLGATKQPIKLAIWIFETAHPVSAGVSWKYWLKGSMAPEMMELS